MADTSTNNEAIVQSLEAGYVQILQAAKVENGNSGVVDIFGDYTWLLNDIKQNTRLPRMYVWEYRQSASTFAATIHYLRTGILNRDVKVNGWFNGTDDDTVQGVIDSLSESKFNKNIIGQNQFLLPYRNMYGFDDTNCLKYVFPYFDNAGYAFKQEFGEKAQVETQFQQALDQYFGNSGIFGGGIASKVTDLASLYGEIKDKGATFEYNNSGVFMERPKYFQFDASGDTANVKFTLYNTIPGKDLSTDPWKKNYLFIKNFILKNLPYRTGLFNYRTPCLYSLAVPGQKFFPAAFVSAFNVSCVGTRRILHINTNVIGSAGTVNSKEVEVIVPEAWEVTISFTSLLAKTANLYYQAFNGNYPTIQIITSDSLTRRQRQSATELGVDAEWINEPVG